MPKYINYIPGQVKLPLLLPDTTATLDIFVSENLFLLYLDSLYNKYI